MNRRRLVYIFIVIFVISLTFQSSNSNAQDVVNVAEVYQKIDLLTRHFNDTAYGGFYSSTDFNLEVSSTRKSFGVQSGVGLMFLTAYSATNNITYLSYAENQYQAAQRFIINNAYIEDLDNDFTNPGTHYFFSHHSTYLQFLAELYRATENSTYLRTVENVYKILEQKFSTGSGGYYFRLTSSQTRDSGVLQFIGYFGIYVNALWKMYEATNNITYYEKGRMILDFVIDKAWNGAAGYPYPHLWYDDTPHENDFQMGEFPHLIRAFSYFGSMNSVYLTYARSMIDAAFDLVLDRSDSLFFHTVNSDGSIENEDKYMTSQAAMIRAMMVYNESANLPYEAWIYLNSSSASIYGYEESHGMFLGLDGVTFISSGNNAIAIEVLILIEQRRLGIYEIFPSNLLNSTRITEITIPVNTIWIILPLFIIGVKDTLKNKHRK